MDSTLNSMALAGINRSIHNNEILIMYDFKSYMNLRKNCFSVDNLGMTKLIFLRNS